MTELMAPGGRPGWRWFSQGACWGRWVLGKWSTESPRCCWSDSATPEGRGGLRVLLRASKLGGRSPFLHQVSRVPLAPRTWTHQRVLWLSRNLASRAPVAHDKANREAGVKTRGNYLIRHPSNKYHWWKGGKFCKQRKECWKINFKS